MAGDPTRLINDVLPYSKNEVRPPIRYSRNIIRNVGSWLRPSRLGKAYRRTKEWTKQGLNHRKTGAFVNTSKIGGGVVGVMGSAGFHAAVVGTGVAVAATSAVTWPAVGLAVGFVALFIGINKAKHAYKKRKVKKQFKQLGDPLHERTQVDMKLFANVLSKGQLVSLCAAVEDMIRARKKFLEERAKWNVGNAFQKTCGDSCLLTWRFLFWGQRLESHLRSAKHLMSLRTFSDQLEEALLDVTTDLTDCGQDCLANMIRGVGLHPYPGNRSSLPNDGLISWSLWFHNLGVWKPELLRAVTLSTEKRIAETIAYNKAVKGSNPFSAEFWNKSRNWLKNHGANWTEQTLVRESGDLLVYDVIRGLAGDTGGDTFSAFLGSQAAAGSIGIPGTLAGYLVNFAIDYGAKALNDKVNMNAFRHPQNGNQLDPIDRLWRLRSILQRGRIQKMFTLMETMKKNCETMKTWANSLQNQTGTHANHQNFELLTMVLKTAEQLSETTILIGFLRRMLNEVTNLMDAEAQQMSREKNQVTTFLQNQVSSDNHARCSGTCYNANENGDPVFPL